MAADTAIIQSIDVRMVGKADRVPSPVFTCLAARVPLHSYAGEFYAIVHSVGYDDENSMMWKMKLNKSPCLQNCFIGI